MLKVILLAVKEGPIFRVLDLNFRIKSLIITVQIWFLGLKFGLICRLKTLIFPTQNGCHSWQRVDTPFPRIAEVTS